MAKILVVDDRAICREFLVTLLGYGHHQMTEASNGAEALKLVLADAPDLIITDLLMPTMNGYELIQKIKVDPKLAKIPVIFYTASYLIDEAKILADTCDVKYVLYKPSDPELILKTVQEALGSNIEATPTAKDAETIKTTDTPHAANRTDNITSLNDLVSMYVSEMQTIKDNLYQFMNEPKRLEKCSNLFTHDLDQVKKISQRLSSMSALSMHVLTERHPKKLLALFAEGARQIMNCEYCGLGIVGNKNEKLKFFVFSSSGDKLTPEIETIDQEHSLAQQIMKSKGIISFNDLTSQIILPKHHPAITNLVGTKLITKTGLYGFIYFANKIDEPKFFDDDIRVANTLATEIALLYENSEMYEAIQKHAVKLQLAMNDITH